MQVEVKSSNLKNPQTVSALIEPVFSHQSYRGASEAVKRGAAEIGISGLTATAKALVVAGLAHNLSWGHAKHGAHRSPSHGPSVVVITADNEAAERLAETTSTFLEWLAGTDAASKVGVLPAFDCSPYDQRSPHPEIAERRAIALWRLAHGATNLLFVPVTAALGRFRQPAFYRSLALEIKVGDEVSLDDLVEHLAGVGY